MKLDLFYQISYESFATEMCERQAKLVLPDAKVFKYKDNLFVDKMGSHPCLNAETAFKFYQYLDESINNSSADYMMILEPDVFISKKPESYPSEAGGIMWNYYPQEIKDRIRMAWGVDCPNAYSMAGGSVISVSSWKDKSFKLDLQDIKEIIDIWDEARAGDTLVSMILLKFGIDIEPWEEVYEAGLGSNQNEASIFHGIKTWYNYS
jgi:hypothetical protein